MAIQVEYDGDIDALIIKADGEVGREEIFLLRDQIIKHSNFKQNINQLFDATGSQLTLSTDDLRKIAYYYGVKFEELGDNRKLALLVSQDLDFGMMRQYEVFFDSGPNVMVQAFRDGLKAKKWLKEPV